MDKIITEQDLVIYETTYRKHFYDLVVTRLMNHEPRNLEAALIQVALRADKREQDRIRKKPLQLQKLGRMLNSIGRLLFPNFLTASF